MELVLLVVAAVFAVFNIVVMAYVLVAAKEAITYFQRENKKAHIAAVTQDKAKHPWAYE